MRTFGKTVLTLGLLAAMASPAWAQRGRGFGGGGFGGGGALLTNKSVQQELKVSGDQATKLAALADEQRTKGQELRTKLQDLPQDERQAKMREYMTTASADLQKGLGTILKPEQLKRYNQIQTQQMGVAAFSSPRVQEALKLTDDQKTQIRELAQARQGAGRGGFQDLRNASADERQAALKKMADNRKAALDKVVALLNADQKTTWKELTGEPFEVKYEPRGNNNN
jgi:hypothetical protein